jgi:very-short-patch-repair endonuclease
VHGTLLASDLAWKGWSGDRGQVHSPEVNNARWLRSNMTETERRVWSRLRGRHVGGYKFRRQVHVGPYVVDFMCVSDRLAVELDGPLHEDEESDQRKTKFLQAQGYRVLRVPVSDVDESIDDVIHGIYLELTQIAVGN